MVAMKNKAVVVGSKLITTFGLIIFVSQALTGIAQAEDTESRRAIPPEPYTFSRDIPAMDELFERRKFSNDVTSGPNAALFERVKEDASSIEAITVTPVARTRSGEFEWKGITVYDPSDRVANALACFVTSEGVARDLGLDTDAKSKDVPSEDYAHCIIETKTQK